MANYRAIASGLWSAGATWAGGAVPPNGEGHNIYSNSFTVTIDTAVNVALLTNAAITASFVGGGTSAVASGGFSVTVSGLSIFANITAGGTATTNALNFSAASPSTLSITGNLRGGGNGIGSASAVNNSSSGIISITTATISAGSYNTLGNGVRNSSSGQINLNNCVISGSGRSQEAGVSNLSTGVINASNCSFGAGVSIYGNSASSVVATNCTFTASTNYPSLEGTGTLRLSGSFIAASNGRQPINALVWILNSTPTASYIQQALDGINANSFVRYYTADNSLGQANPTDVRSGISYASGNLTGRLTVPARGSVALSVNYGPSMPFTATRSGTTATATLTYSYPLVVGDEITVTGAFNSEWNSTYTIASVVSGTSVTFTVPDTHNAAAGVGAVMQTTGTAVLDPAAVASAVWGAATRTLTAGAGISASDVWSHASRTITGGLVDTATTLTNAPTVPSVVQIRQEMDSNSTKLASIKAKTDLLETTRLAQCSTVATTGDQIAAAFNSP